MRARRFVLFASTGVAAAERASPRKYRRFISCLALVLDGCRRIIKTFFQNATV